MKTLEEIEHELLEAERHLMQIADDIYNLKMAKETKKKPLPKTKEELKSSLIKFGIDYSENITREEVEEYLEGFED